MIVDRDGVADLSHRSLPVRRSFSECGTQNPDITRCAIHVREWVGQEERNNGTTENSSVGASGKKAKIAMLNETKSALVVVG